MSTKLTRRKFLAAAGAGAAAAAAVVATRPEEQNAIKQAGGPRDGKGYQLTAHVRRYYETTKV